MNFWRKIQCTKLYNFLDLILMVILRPRQDESCIGAAGHIIGSSYSAQDVSMQAQVLNLLSDLQHKLNLTYLFISLNLAVVEHISHRIIMYRGKVSEMGNTCSIFSNPMHPYPEALLSAIPNPDIDQQSQQILLKGDIPSPVNIRSGCNFHTRFPHAMEICRTQKPFLRQIEKDHYTACHLR